MSTSPTKVVVCVAGLGAAAFYYAEAQLETSAPRFSALRPQNPVASFVVGQRDDVFTFDQKFEEIRPAAVRVAGPPRPVKFVR